MNPRDLAAELREQILSLTQYCPQALRVDDCPFRLLNGLCWGTKVDTLQQMDYAALLSLFDFSTSCACPADPRRAMQEPAPLEDPLKLKETDIPEA